MRVRLSVTAVTAAMVLAVAPARAAVETIVAGPGSQALGSFATPLVVARQGAAVTFLNQDVQPHGVVSTAKGPSTQPWCGFFAEDSCPLLWAPVTDAGGRTSLLRGMSNTSAGEVYGLFCPIHPSVIGRLAVV